MSKIRNNTSVLPEVRSIHSPDLEYGKNPIDSENCHILVEFEIGPKGSEGADVFSCEVVTPVALKQVDKRWGKGLLIVQNFSWPLVESSIQNLLSHCVGNDWNEVAEKLNKELYWEFENYREFKE